MADNNLANILFAPTPFKDSNKPLLSSVQWQSIQLLINDLRSLLDLVFSKRSVFSEVLRNVPSTENPYPTLHDINDSAQHFIDDTSAKVYQLAGDLYDYGKKAEVHFKSVIQLLGLDTIDWDNIRKLLNELQKTSISYKANVQMTYNGLVDYVDLLQKHKIYLELAENDLAEARQIILAVSRETLFLFDEFIHQITSLLGGATQVMIAISSSR